MKKKRLLCFVLTAIMIFTGVVGTSSDTVYAKKVPTYVNIVGYTDGTYTQEYSYFDTTAVFQGRSIQMRVKATPKKTVKWKSSNKSIATIDKKGVVTAKKAGTVTITASIGKVKDSCKLIVKKNTLKLNATNRTLVVGETCSIYVKGSGFSPYCYFEDDNNCVDFQTSGNACIVTAYAPGSCTMSVRQYGYIDGYYMGWDSKCNFTVLEKGISRQQCSVAQGSGTTLYLSNVEDACSVIWNSSNPAVASIDQTGYVVGNSVGDAVITATVMYEDGSTEIFSSSVKVSNPKFSNKETVLAVGGTFALPIQGTNDFSSISCISSKETTARVNANGTVTGVKKGSATITANIDGRTLTYKIYISNPKLKSDYACLSPSQTATIKLKGLSSKSKIKYTSSNKSNVSVTKKGVVKAKRKGKATISVNVDSVTYAYNVEVTSRQAIAARATGYSIINSSTYSQARRMSPGFYDCSALVFRSYGCNTALLGGTPSWAPTAANMAVHMSRTGKVLAMGPVDVSELLPGDLIFYGGENNGRYLGINHVSMYYGNGKRLEKPLYNYYPSDSIVMVARPIL